MGVSITVSAQRGGSASVLAIAEAARTWRTAGESAALARVVAANGPSPRPAGSMMAISATGALVGSLAGGCIDGAVADAALAAIGSCSRPVLEAFGDSDGDAFGVGLSCGARVQVLIDPAVPGWLDAVAGAIGQRTPIAVVTAIGGSPGRFGATMTVGPDGAVGGSLGDDALDALGAATGQGALCKSAVDTAPAPDVVGEASLFVQAFLPPARLVIVGAVDIAESLSRVGAVLGYEVVVIDPRAAFATPARLPDADRVEARWPAEVLEELGLAEDDAVCVMTHDHKVDVPALAAALASPAGYVGALGSRATNAERTGLLAERGVPPEALGRLMAPIGLDLGARRPEEIAVAIAAELVAMRNGTAAVFLRDGEGPIHRAGDIR